MISLLLVPREDVNRARANQIYAALKQEGREAMDALGYEAVQDVMKRIAVPVDYSTNPPTRSKKGEPPRMDTQELENNVTWEVSYDNDSVTVDVISRRPSTPDVPEELEYEKNRPYMRPSFEQQRQTAASVIAEVLKR